ncbi:Ppx/GppA phosphatase family protein [soil metagenome]
MKRVAAIDIGTNTCLMLIAEKFDNSLKVIADLQRVPRIGRNVDADRKISADSVKNLIDVLKEYKEICTANVCEEIIAVGTSALRDAANSQEILSEVKESTGISIECISGEREAALSYFGAISGISSGKDNCIMLDIGGGSTELCFLENGEIVRRSLDIGSVRITEKFFIKDNHSELISAQEFIRREFHELSDLNFENKKLVVVAGTVTTLALIKKEHKDFDPEIQNLILTANDIDEMFEKLKHISKEDILKLGSYMENRSDIIFAGSLILNEFLKFSMLEQVIVSIRGLRYGLALESLDLII